MFDFEIEAGGTQFQAGTDSRIALETLVDGDQWMIYRNIFTNVLHWDFVGAFTNAYISYISLMMSLERPWEADD